MTLQEIEKALADYKAALDRKVVIVTKQLQGYTITGNDLEFLMTGFYEQERKFEQIAPKAIRLLLPIAKAAVNVIATEELSGEWDESMNTLEMAINQLEGQSDDR